MAGRPATSVMALPATLRLPRTRLSAHLGAPLAASSAMIWPVIEGTMTVPPETAGLVPDSEPSFSGMASKDQTCDPSLVEKARIVLLASAM